MAHHFDSAQQQSEAAKLGMWLFLATELLLFGGLFCLYAVFRSTHTELFAYGSRFLDTPWGAINTGVLIVSSFTMAMAVSCAQTNQKRAMVAFLAMTLFLGLDFLGIKCIEYSHKFHDNLVWGLGLYEMPEHEALKQRLAHAEGGPTPPTLEPGEAQAGKPLYLQGCLGCHGARGQGLPGLGKPLQTSRFVADSSDTALLEFLRTGRPIDDPANTSGVAMPPRGGNPRLRDQGLVHIIAFVRTLQEEADGAASLLDDSAQEFVIPRSVIPFAAEGPPGLNPRFFNAVDNPSHSASRHDELLSPRLDASRPANLHQFFGIYFLMTGLHGFHVLAGMVVITWLLVRAVRGDFSARYFTPVDLGGLYWHIVDIIWIFLFPLFYLIH